MAFAAEAMSAPNISISSQYQSVADAFTSALQQEQWGKAYEYGLILKEKNVDVAMSFKHYIILNLHQSNIFGPTKTFTQRVAMINEWQKCYEKSQSMLVAPFLNSRAHTRARFYTALQSINSYVFLLNANAPKLFWKKYCEIRDAKKIADAKRTAERHEAQRQAVQRNIEANAAQAAANRIKGKEHMVQTHGAQKAYLIMNAEKCRKQAAPVDLQKIDTSLVERLSKCITHFYNTQLDRFDVKLPTLGWSPFCTRKHLGQIAPCTITQHIAATPAAIEMLLQQIKSFAEPPLVTLNTQADVNSRHECMVRIGSPTAQVQVVPLQASTGLLAPATFTNRILEWLEYVVHDGLLYLRVVDRYMETRAALPSVLTHPDGTTVTRGEMEKLHTSVDEHVRTMITQRPRLMARGVKLFNVLATACRLTFLYKDINITIFFDGTGMPDLTKVLSSRSLLPLDRLAWDMQHRKKR